MAAPGGAADREAVVAAVVVPGAVADREVVGVKEADKAAVVVPGACHDHNGYSSSSGLN